MSQPFIAGREALVDAWLLIGRFGDCAEHEAASRARSNRDAGNLLRFCHWRQIERLIATLVDHQVQGMVH